jgi:beta-lactamase superfamily II metal-dependent hydrolase
MAAAVAALAVAVGGQARTTLDVYFIDVEGGQATLIVAPSGASMLVDAGWSGVNGRDADRIAAAVKQAGLSKIDYLVVTHYHRDHVGGVPELAAKIPVGTFVDHGPTVEEGAQPAELFNAYVASRQKGRHLQVKPGDTIPVAGLDVRVVSAGGELAKAALPGGGSPNPLCGAFKPKDADPTENARSVGMVLSFGRFRMLDLGDLTWNKEQGLVCPNNLLGPIDLYLTTHHGSDQSGADVLVHAIRPRVAIMNNGATKGGTPPAWQTVRAAPGLQDIWQVHRAVNADAAHNAPEPFIANLDETTAFGLKVSAERDGSFTVTNARNGQSKRYGPRQ